MSENEYQVFGKYLLLDVIASSDSAKNYRAYVLTSSERKLVVVKVFHCEVSREKDFYKKFNQKLKVLSSLAHPNIAQIYEYGKVEEQLYIAMEYVDGQSLQDYLNCLKKMSYVFPVEITTHIISQICMGLHYGHTYKEDLIHQDISPHNIVISYDGVVKIIDFSLLYDKNETQSGIMIGKLSYLAPEYLQGMELNHHYDQFAVGITIWEMLCAKKLFTAKNDLAVLKLIQACKIPKPSSINPNVPPELDDIIMKALSKDREQRFDSMDKLNRALVKFLYSNYPDFSPVDLNYFTKQLFKKEIEVDKRKISEFEQIDLKQNKFEIQESSNSVADDRYKSFGEFSILDRIKQKPEGNIYRCFAKDDPSNILTLKVFKPEVVRNQMVIDTIEGELKILFGLEHPNIPKIIDFGMNQDKFYTVREYVHGITLEHLLSRLNDHEIELPIPFALYLISQISSALDYAHKLSDKLTGRAYNILHRDINPSHIIIDYHGGVKIIGFASYKASTTGSAADKLALSYIAPEYLDGMILDHRHDQFALAVNLWELLCGRRLFSAKKDLEVLKLIQKCEIPKPSSINSEIGSELDVILLKALSKYREERYEDMDRFSRELVKYTYSYYPDFDPEELATFVKRLFQGEYSRDEAKFREIMGQ